MIPLHQWWKCDKKAYVFQFQFRLGALRTTVNWQQYDNQGARGALSQFWQPICMYNLSEIIKILMQNLSFVAKIWCLEVAQWSQSLWNKHQSMDIGSFSISTLVMFAESYWCRRVDFFIFGTMLYFLSTICKAYCVVFIFEMAWLGGGAIQPLPRNKETTELRRYPTVGPHARVQTTELQNQRL